MKHLCLLLLLCCAASAQRDGRRNTTPLPPTEPPIVVPAPPLSGGRTANVPTSYPYLGQSLRIVWDADVEQSIRNALWTQLKAALDLANRTTFTERELAVGRLLKSVRITQASPNSVMCIDTQAKQASRCAESAQFMATVSYLLNPYSTPWLASVLMHEAMHQKLFNEGGWSAAVGLIAERAAMDFQITVGARLGLGQWELDYLRNSIHQGA